MKWVLLAGVLCGLVLLLLESWLINRWRSRVKHVVHVNGTRGKTSTCRLITTIIQAQGRRALCKTTGTTPQMVHIDGSETEIKRNRPVNIYEQVRVLRQAAREGAEILVVECMAVRPEYQLVCERSILRADMAVITNVRLDHVEEMGQTRSEVARSLSAMMPTGGLCFTAEAREFSEISRHAVAQKTRLLAVRPKAGFESIDHPDNVALALAVCKELGISEESSLKALEAYRKDAYAARSWALPGGGRFYAFFSNNDPESTISAIRDAQDKGSWQGEQTVLILNGRLDRPRRTLHMMQVVQMVWPREIWMASGIPLAIRMKVKRMGIPYHRIKHPHQILQSMNQPLLFCGIGNLQGFGKDMMDMMAQEGVLNVS